MIKGCLRAIGCLGLLMVVGAGSAWYARGWWLPKVGLRPTQQVAAARWQPPTDSGARRADAALKRLQAPRGPAFANLSAGDLVSWLVKEIGKAMPPSADSIQAAVVGDRLYVRLSVKTADIGKDILGPLGSFMRDRERITLGGTLHVIRPGFSELRVKDVMIGSVRVPQAAIPSLLRQFGGERPAGLSEDGVALATPEYIGDVRIANGQITVYRKS